MRTQAQIEKVIDKFDSQEDNFSGMTYEQGIEEALLWVLEEISNEEFHPADNAGIGEK